MFRQTYWDLYSTPYARYHKPSTICHIFNTISFSTILEAESSVLVLVLDLVQRSSHLIWARDPSALVFRRPESPFRRPAVEFVERL